MPRTKHAPLLADDGFDLLHFLNDGREREHYPALFETIIREMNDDDDAARCSARFIEEYAMASSEERELIDRILIRLCGWPMKTLLEKTTKNLEDLM